MEGMTAHSESGTAKVELINYLTCCIMVAHTYTPGQCEHTVKGTYLLLYAI
jgi:hypothetical protein